MELLCSSTVRIETRDISNNCYFGTGFFFNLSVDGNVVPLIITNKHVVKGMDRGYFVLTEQDKNGNPMYKQHFTVVIEHNFEKHWIMHPDPNIDLCVMPINPI